MVQRTSKRIQNNKNKRKISFGEEKYNSESVFERKTPRKKQNSTKKRSESITKLKSASSESDFEVNLLNLKPRNVDFIKTEGVKIAPSRSELEVKKEDEEEDEFTLQKFYDGIDSFFEQNLNNNSVYGGAGELIGRKPAKDQSQIDSFSLFEQENGMEQEEVVEEPAQEEPLTQVLDSLVETISKKKEKLKVFNFNSGNLIVLPLESSIKFHGLCNLEVVRGRIDVLGFEIAKSNSQKLYSPRGSSLLVLHNKTTKSKSPINLQRIAELLQDNEAKEVSSYLKSRSDSCFALVLCTPLQDHKMSFVAKYMDQKLFPVVSKTSKCGIQAVLEPSGPWMDVKVDLNWYSMVKDFKKDKRMLVAGGKGVGKSTFIRFVVNRLLEKFKEVLVVDLDPGQSEFTVAGCVSVVRVKEPLLGPNYTHVMKSFRSILTSINAAQNPHQYIEAVQELVKSLPQNEAPVIINTMGFTQGLGINILSAVSCLVQPNEIIYFKSKNNKSNFPVQLSLKEITQNAQLFDVNSTLKATIQEVTSLVEDTQKGVFFASSRLVREALLLAYFGSLMSEQVQSLTSHQLPAFQIELDNIAITNEEGDSIPAEAIIANPVALCCKVSEESSLFQCFGWGLVRGVSSDGKEVILITPEALNVLENVTHLVLTTLNFPASVYMASDELNGCVPYVMDGEVVPVLGQVPKRLYFAAGQRMPQETN